MPDCVICAASSTSGVRHRFAMLSGVKCFAERYGYSVCMLWGVTKGVAFCRFEELFAPIPAVRVVNIASAQLSEFAKCARTLRNVIVGDRSFRVFRPGDAPRENLFSWDLIASGALAKLTGPTWPQLVAQPAAPICAHTNAYARAHRIEARLGIRVRVDEGLATKRRPRRVMRELNETVRSIIRIPWYTKVFLATDSEYIQQMLASHFPDIRFLSKSFDLQDPTGKYVHRQDHEAMLTFLREVDCLCHCKRIINIGGFLNERSVKHKILDAPYADAASVSLVRR